MRREIRGLPPDLEDLREPKGRYVLPEALVEGVAKTIWNILRELGWNVPRPYMEPAPGDEPFHKHRHFILPPQQGVQIGFHAPKDMAIFLHRVNITPADDYSARNIKVVWEKDGRLREQPPPDWQTMQWRKNEMVTIDYPGEEGFAYNRVLVKPNHTLTLIIDNQSQLGSIEVIVNIEGWVVSMGREPCYPEP